MYYLEQKYSYKKSIKNSVKEKYAYGGYEITFDSASSWSFDSNIAGNVAIFGVDNISSSNCDDHQNNF